MTQLFGDTKSEVLANEKMIARQIVAEINNFGVNDRQRLLVMYFIAMELENFEESRELAEIIKAKKPELFLVQE